MLPSERLPFSAVDKQPPLEFPDNVRVVFWPVLRDPSRELPSILFA